ncbi:23S rRNA (guanosine(2251)-2'-O)-methyltransferase RlmB [Thiomicrospira sp. WB1]|uniref:23S rRNA (guanosine(2251)-2'-O)-methyltransferase RlmB n=1 Tax=Thiomicrospira sp. WB1 TaxID=1685380 RepID=UPI00074A867C|nr:23S rRNA (guanosine(2251)-2'-O)-methyltransferase RlmB [Thiomicrospira sp. WB1]KUJ71587.1 23S rRNA methyltransferase [Thiomicrospira sp. WB1]
MSTQLLYGLHAVETLLKQSPQSIIRLSVQPQPNARLKKLSAQANALGVRCEEHGFKQQVARLPKDAVHQGVVAEVVAKTPLSPKQWLAQLEGLIEQGKAPLVVFLDEVQDPHNLGAILRTADACGVMSVVIPKHQSVGLNATVRKVASGAAESVDLVVVPNLARAIGDAQKRGLWVTGLAGETSQTLYDQSLTGPTGLVMGAEGKGLRKGVREQCDFLAAIPMAGVVDSLNVSVATGVALYEAIRQRCMSSSSTT